MSDAAPDDFDLLIIGGGINGVGIARDASGRGLRVALCEMDDLGSATSSASTKLIHGGLRYLEHFEFRLVREALAEREVLLAIAPHIVRPMRFVMPHAPGLRPAWMLRAGLFLYDRLSRRVTLPASHAVDLPTSPYGVALKPEFRRGFVYSDCWVDDSRLVVANARDAADHGARVMTRTRFEGATRRRDAWRANLRCVDKAMQFELDARVLVNATGPWVTRTLSLLPQIEQRHRVRLVKGSHIVVPRVYPGDHALILQNDDDRVVFIIPFEEHYSLIGTTDVVVSGDPAAVSVGEDEIAYLCRAVGRYLTRPVSAAEIVWRFAGVRPLFDDGERQASRVSRDYALELEDDQAAILNVYGGKLTTYRRLAERAVELLAPRFTDTGPAWTSKRPLPGGALPADGLGGLIEALSEKFPGRDRTELARLARRYGSLAFEVPGGAGDAARFGPDLDADEVKYLVDREWARRPEDILWRRTKAGLRADDDARRRLGDYLEALSRQA